jgi:hypothetical protein
MNLRVIGIIVIVLASVTVLGCVESQPSPPTPIENPKSTVVYTEVPTTEPTVVSTPAPTQAHQYRDSSNFLLSVTDLPSNESWTIEERGERNVNDVNPNSLEYNWSGGYYIYFTSSKNDKVTYLEQYISIYPEENILAVLNMRDLNQEPLSNPSIGEQSRAFKSRTSQGSTYGIVFVKNNILVSLINSGTNPDYFRLIELAQKVYTKIDGYGKPFAVEIIKPTELNLKVGSTAKSSEKEVTVFSVQKSKSYDYSYSGQNYVRYANPTKIFILMDVEIKNVGSNSIDARESDFSITDSDLYKYDYQSYYGNDEFQSTELYPNQKAKGKLLFEVPDNSSGLKIQFNFVSSNIQVTINGQSVPIKTELASWMIE